VKTFSKIAAVGAALATLCAATSSQAAVFLGFQSNGGAITQVSSGANVAAFAGAFGAFELGIASGTDGVFPQLLGSQIQMVNRVGGNAGVLDVYLTVSDLTGSPGTFFSSFAMNVLPAGWTVRMRTYADDANGKWGGALLSDHTFNAINTFTDFASADLDGAYSLTSRYTITAPTNGQALGNTAIEAVVPEPATWALMLMGFGGAGYMIRRRRTAFA
jgi:hypothetical protein